MHVNIELSQNCNVEENVSIVQANLKNCHFIFKLFIRKASLFSRGKALIQIQCPTIHK